MRKIGDFVEAATWKEQGADFLWLRHKSEIQRWVSLV